MAYEFALDCVRAKDDDDLSILAHPDGELIGPLKSCILVSV
jgi:hypothetical protein